MPLLALSIASCVVTFIVQRRGGAVSTFERTPLTARVENALVAYVGYLRKAIWPSDLAVAYPHPGASLPGATVALAALALVGATALALKAAKARPYVPVGWFWYLGTLVPVIGIVQVGPQAMADRYAYVPLVGAAIVVAWGAADLAARRPQARAAVAAAAIAAVAAMMVVTWSQVRVWRNGVSLWERAVARTRDNYIAVTNLGVALHKQGKIDEALSRYLDALRINARYEITHYNLGLAVAEQGKMDEAERHFREALRINPKYAEAHNNLGIVLATTGRRGEAIEHLTQALAINPDYVDALHNLGLVLTQEGRYDEAISRFSRVLALKPDHAGARAALARVEAFRK
jgi:tetratricopeptide (TPR) repeat protein